MNCSELRQRLDSYSRNRLSPEETAGFEAHLTTCSACSLLLEDAEPRLHETASLSPAVEPGGDLWPGIRSRLDRRGSGVRRRVIAPNWMLAAAAVLLVVVSSGVTALLLRQSPTQPVVQPSSAFRPMEAQYASATADLVLALEKARSRLSPATIATIQRNLAVIDSALAESRRALAADPRNVTLEQLVVAAWRQKMDFLRRATALPTEI